MKHIHIIILLIFSLNPVLKAQEMLNERVIVHTDKDCYIAGEEILVKMTVVNSLNNVSLVSKTGYIEICDTEKPYIQYKLALEKGKGWGKIRIPDHVPSGIYLMYGYTRFMRNEGEQVFFKRLIAIINAGRRSANDRMEIVETAEINTVPEQNTSGISISTDSRKYANRAPVQLTLNGIPENMIDLTLSVSRDDSITFFDAKEATPAAFTPISASPAWLPEFEGHIICGKIIPAPAEDEILIPNVSFVGKDIRYVNGKINSADGSVLFYTKGVYDRQQIVSTLVDGFYDKPQYRLDVVSPFCEFLPDSLPLLKAHFNRQNLTDRFIGAQLLNFHAPDSADNKTLKPYYNFTNPLVYDLDEYTRFSTLSETIFEFVYQVRVGKNKNRRIIRVYDPEQQAFNKGNTLVLLDGIPVYNHEKMLAYNPYLLRKILIYSGWFTFGGEPYGSIVSFVTHAGNMPTYKLDEESQLFEYDCPALPDVVNTPDWSDMTLEKQRTPDMRHTLYWNPTVENIADRQITFYTSDVCGRFTAKISGVTANGDKISASCAFVVE